MEITQKTKQEFYQELKTAHPEILIGIDDEIVKLSDTDYEARLQEWAQVEFDKQQAQIAEQVRIEEEKTKRESALAKLATLGLEIDDLKALGLGGN